MFYDSKFNGDISNFYLKKRFLKIFFQYLNQFYFYF